MNQDEIIEMGAQAGIHREVLMLGRNLELLADFANLVAKHTLSNIDPSKFMSYQEGIEAGRFAEREACAKLCDEARAARLAEAIRARGETK